MFVYVCCYFIGNNHIFWGYEQNDSSLVEEYNCLKTKQQLVLIGQQYTKLALLLAMKKRKGINGKWKTS